MSRSEVLTEREQQALEHMRKAQELGVTLSFRSTRLIRVSTRSL
jgi:hypothetical protein